MEISIFAEIFNIMNRSIFIFIFVLSSFCSVAQETDTLIYKSYDLDEVVIQSFKQDKALKELPTSVSRISRGMIKNQQMFSTKELNAFIPNLFIPDYGSKYTSPVFIRGIGSKTGSPSVGLYVDGIPYFEKSTFDYDLSDIESIEVYRGPQGTLYGRNTMGGLINIVTCSPLKHERTNFSFDGAAHNQYIASASHYGKVNDSFGYAVSGKYHYEGGFFNNSYKEEKADKGESWNARVRLEWQAEPSLRFSLISSFDRSLQGANAYAPYDVETGERGEIAYNAPSYYHRTLSSTGLGVNYRKEKIQINYLHSFQYTRDKLRQDQDFTVKDRVNSLISRRQLMTSGELTVKNQIGSGYRALTGAFGFYQHVDKDVSTFFTKSDSYKNDVIPTAGIAVYHQSVFERLGLEGLSLTLGLRYDYEWAERDFKAWKNADAPRSQYTSQHFSQFVPKVALQYMFHNSGQLYASVSKGYKTGGFNTSFNTDDEKCYKPESSWNYEIGAKHPFWNKKLNAEVSFFWIDWRDQQIQQKVDAGGFMIRNAGKSVSKGLEVSMLCNPVNGLMVRMNYGFTHASFSNYRYSAETDYTGNFIPMVPRHTLSGSINFTRPLQNMFIDRFQVGMNFTGNGKTYWHENNNVYQPFYALLNASASVSWKQLTVGVWAKNITDTQYIAYLFKSSSGTFVQSGRPFTIGANLSISI